MYATDRQTDVRQASSLNASAQWGRGHNAGDIKFLTFYVNAYAVVYNYIQMSTNQ